jgi:uncharacterized protein (TIGR01319 family)
LVYTHGRTAIKTGARAVGERDLRFLIDFGSTFTKLVVVDLDREQVVGRYQVPSTVGTDITMGLMQILQAAKDNIGVEKGEGSVLLACSSAAGGLRMITVGLVPSLSSEAGVRAALGAGARVVSSFSYELTLQDVVEIERINPDIVLLIGGTDGGNKTVILHNAERLSALKSTAPIVVAGNRAARDEIEAIFAGSKKLLVFSNNVMPQIGALEVDACRDAIRRIFISHIVKAKGIDKAIGIVDAAIIPTPSAVLKAAELLAKGTDREKGLGELMVVDVGGATTDVYSIASGNPTHPGAMLQGLPEPYAKRTVEGDLGVRHNIDSLLEMGRPGGDFNDGHFDEIKNRFLVPSKLPKDEIEFELDSLLASVAVDIAGRRHCGQIKVTQGPFGELTVQEGKDLSAIRCVIGTGGPIVFARSPEKVLRKILFRANSPHILRPKEADLHIDKSYALYAMGLLSQQEPDKALRIMKKIIIRI